MGLLHGQPPAHAATGQTSQRSSEPTSELQSLQVLQVAQQKADEYVANARHEAERIRSQARAHAEQIVRDAQAQGHSKLQEAERGLADAQSKADQIVRDSRSQADKVQRDADAVLADARKKAAEIAAAAKESAEGIERQAQREHAQGVGNLETKRDALQARIESLQTFEHTYRSRITVFLQDHLRALWAERPEVHPGEIEQPVPPVPTSPPTIRGRQVAQLPTRQSQE